MGVLKYNIAVYLMSDLLQMLWFRWKMDRCFKHLKFYTFTLELICEGFSAKYIIVIFAPILDNQIIYLIDSALMSCFFMLLVGFSEIIFAFTQ